MSSSKNVKWHVWVSPGAFPNARSLEAALQVWKRIRL